MTNIRTSPQKARKPQARSLPLRQAISAVAADYAQMTIRQLFYQLVSRGALEKTEAAYKRVCDMAVQMRLDGTLPYYQIVDGARERRRAPAHDNLAEALEYMQTLYRRNAWLDQPVWVEIWCEKDALSGLILPVCNRYGVTYVACRGFPSLTLIYESAQEMRARGKPTRVYYFGDHDASGRAISVNLETKLRAHGADVTVRRVGLEPGHLRAYALPTRPGKATDSRHKAFAAQYGEASVELDALPPAILTEWVELAILENINPAWWERTLAIEAQERLTLASIAALPLEPGMRLTLSAA